VATLAQLVAEIGRRVAARAEQTRAKVLDQARAVPLEELYARPPMRTVAAGGGDVGRSRE
jgi:hypothetical protein